MASRPAILVLIATQLLSLLPTSLASTPSPILGSATTLRKRAGNGNAYDNPLSNGGYMLTIVNDTYPAGLGEPLNVILSAQSDPAVLAISPDDGGFLNYMLSTNLGQECLGQTLGSRQEANLGDGKGNVSQVETLRWNYGNPYIGTCQETFEGGLHLRYWVQNTTGAVFIATSVEEGASSGHDIVLDGYNLGRDELVGNLTKAEVHRYNVTNETTFSGNSTYANYTYQTDVKYVSGLLQNSSDGINHYLTVETKAEPAIDGLVAVLTVKILSSPKTSGALPLVRLCQPLLLFTASVIAASLVLL